MKDIGSKRKFGAEKVGKQSSWRAKRIGKNTTGLCDWVFRKEATEETNHTIQFPFLYQYVLTTKIFEIDVSLNEDSTAEGSLPEKPVFRPDEENMIDSTLPDPRIIEVMTRIRRFIEPVWEWADSGHEENFERLCGPSVILLKEVLEQETGDAWRLRGGDPEHNSGAGPVMAGQAGILGRDGEFHFHLWAGRVHDGMIADLAGDRFGYDPILVTVRIDPRYVAAFDDEEAREAAWRGYVWPFDWQPLWRASGGRVMEVGEIDEFMERQRNPMMAQSQVA